MAITAASYVANKNVTFAESTSVEITKAELESAGAANGMALFVHVYLERTSKAISCEINGGAATEVSPEQKETAGFRFATFCKVWNGSTALKVTWASSEKSGRVVTVDIWSGTDPTTPKDATGTFVTWAAATEATAAAVTTATANAQVVTVQTNATGAQYKEAPSGNTLRNNSTSPSTCSIEKEAAGSSGTLVIKFNSSSGLCLRYAIRGVEAAAPTNVSGMVI